MSWNPLIHKPQIIIRRSEDNTGELMHSLHCKEPVKWYTIRFYFRCKISHRAAGGAGSGMKKGRIETITHNPEFEVLVNHSHRDDESKGRKGHANMRITLSQGFFSRPERENRRT